MLKLKNLPANLRQDKQMKSKLSKIIRDSIIEFDITEPVNFTINSPKHSHFGDYSTNVALILSKLLKKQPVEIAKILIEKMKNNLPPIIYDIRVASPGFINFYLDTTKVLYDTLQSQNNTLPKVKQKVIIEHTSVNPNKAMHIGHLRNAILGDTLARILKNFFVKIEIQNYIDDTGVQVADTVAALTLFGQPKEDSKAFDDYCWDIYSKFHKELKNENKQQDLIKLREEILHQIESQQGEYFKISQRLVRKIVDHHLYELNKLGITHNLLIYERDIIGFKLWETAFELLKQKGLIKYYKTGKYAGCWVFKSPNIAEPKILVRSNGTKVYTAKDIAYHLWKVGALNTDFKYSIWEGKLYTPQKDLYQTDPTGQQLPNRFGQADIVINVIDYRQSYPQQVVREAVEEIINQKDVIYHIPYGVVSLSPKTAALLGIDTSDNRKSYPMSGRKGIGIKSKDLFKKVKQVIKEKVEKTYQDAPHLKKQIDIDAITVAAIRYQLISYTVTRDIIFDIEEATSYTGKTGPYLQYSFVRAYNIIQKANQNNLHSLTILPNIQIPNNYTFSQYEKELIHLLYKHDEVLYESALNLEPAIYAEYAFALANAFNSFYEKHSVINERDDKVKALRLNLVIIFASIMQKVLNNLGIPIVYKM